MKSAANKTGDARMLALGMSFAKAHNLIPGVAFSAAQMAHLTSDIVWLVEKMQAVRYENATAMENAINNSRFESWIITTRPNGSTEIQVLDSFGKPKPTSSSKLLSIQNSISGAQP